MSQQRDDGGEAGHSDDPSPDTGSSVELTASPINDRGDNSEMVAASAALDVTKAVKVGVAVAVSLTLVVFGVVFGVVVFSRNKDSNDDSGPSYFAVPSGVGMCNGKVSNCAKRVNEVVWPATHNSFSAQADNFFYANHYLGMATQLQHGFRALMIDLWLPSAAQYPPGTSTAALDGTNKVYLCHGDCSIGGYPLYQGLLEVKRTLDTHPNDVIILLVEQEVNMTDLAAAFEVVGSGDNRLINMTWTSSSSPVTANPAGSFLWPTMQDLIDSGKRLMVFSDVNQGDVNHPLRVKPELGEAPVPWAHHIWDFMFENGFSYSSAAQFDCAINRGSNANALILADKLPVLNHFAAFPFATADLAAAANTEASIQGHFNSCGGAWGQQPCVVAVDYWTVWEPLRTIFSL